MRRLTYALAFALLLPHAAVRGEQIVVSNYGVTTNGMPFAIALEKGFFQEFHAAVVSTVQGGAA